MDNTNYWIALLLAEGVGNVTKHEMLRIFGSPENIFEQKISKNDFPRLRGDVNFADIRDNYLRFSEKIMKFCERENVEILTLESEKYPPLLRKINQAPFVLFCKGNTEILSDRAVGIVGTREPNNNGKIDTHEISIGLAGLGYVIVSGLARGVDTIAHNSALKIRGGKTVAVMATGIDEITPVQNVDLAKNIIDCGGAVITEQIPGKMAFSPNFVLRNRIISGLSECTIVISAPEKSGALRTAEYAIQQGRKCLVAPGQRNDERYDGSNNLLLKKEISPALKLSSIVSFINGSETARQEIEQLGMFDNLPKTTTKKETKLRPKLQEDVLRFLSKKSISLEELSIKSGIDIAVLTETLFDLEMDGAVTADFSGNYLLA